MTGGTGSAIQSRRAANAAVQDFTPSLARIRVA
ncbi:MAG: hypothetical protein AVDCRST_MAG49-226 [uncultured Thermomicrobiales bacterium]|uniref:Uncharacterized protein n=1 Tax=uncultured Thermomicrobiales bacterium TaxID=1645740 RepID=A0A6J4U1V5_9BACT|nr:MAG: hypothetical protein AVDCRST_MAG49-226 [uncultured Thermomicrobiales bacterium]